VIEQTNPIAWFGIYSVIQAGKDPLKIGPPVATNQGQDDSTIQLVAPSDASARVLSQIK
jgi:hypothetical protein